MKTMSSKELLKIIDSQWATTKDIMQIGSIGKNQALKIKNEIKHKLQADDYFLPNNLIPMESVLNHFKININYLKKIAECQRGNNSENIK